MRKLGLALVLAVLLPALPATAADQKCETGPVMRNFGKAPWMVYSCDDKKTLVLISAPGNPATPAFFVMNPLGDGYEIQNKGSANQTVSTAAYHDLKNLSAKEIAELIAATEAQ